MRLLGVFAHPDDEVFCVRGTLAQWAEAGCDTMIISATRSVTGQDFYVRQLRDMKLSFAPEEMLVPEGWHLDAQVCGWTLARAHARSGDRIQLAAYPGSKPTLDEAIADFAEAYADQTELDHAALVAAVKSGRITAQTGV